MMTKVAHVGLDGEVSLATESLQDFTQDLPYQIAKSTPWRRMTQKESEIMDGVMAETEAKTKQIYMASLYLWSGDPLWQTLHQLLADNLEGGSARADVLLAPEE